MTHFPFAVQKSDSNSGPTNTELDLRTVLYVEDKRLWSNKAVQAFDAKNETLKREGSSRQYKLVELDVHRVNNPEYWRELRGQPGDLLVLDHHFQDETQRDLPYKGHDIARIIDNEVKRGIIQGPKHILVVTTDIGVMPKDVTERIPATYARLRDVAIYGSPKGPLMLGGTQDFGTGLINLVDLFYEGKVPVRNGVTIPR